MKEIRYSKQRDVIKKYLKSVKTHPSAEDVYEALKNEYPNLSLGTVYRNLNLLVENQEAIKINTKSNILRYDGNISYHCHFVCKTCGCIEDIHIEKIKEMDKVLESVSCGEIENYELNFSGICNKCKNNN